VSYNEKHNADNGEDNNDGHNDNRSYNYGEEGPTENPDIIATRERQKRNFLTTLLFSHGTPMLLAGTSLAARRRATTTATARTARSRGSTGRDYPKTTLRCASLPAAHCPSRATAAAAP
jgi:hypothetical protein